VDRADDLLPWLARDVVASLPLAAARDAAFEAAFAVPDGTPAPAPARALVTAEERTSLRMLLAVEDRVTMALGLESRPVACLGRVPDVARRLPEGGLVGPDGEGKRTWRAALAGRIPEVVRVRPEKRGFPTPFHRAATGAGRAAALAVLESARFRARGLFDVAACRRLLDEPRPAHDRALFSILLHETYFRLFLDGDAFAAPRA
jgi:asparagine synthetase B (glutamine-hydrolysing)